MNRIHIPSGYKLIVCGDTHGHLRTLFRIFTMEGFPDENRKVIYVCISLFDMISCP